MRYGPISQIAACAFLLQVCMPFQNWSQTLDETLLEQASESSRHTLSLKQTEAGPWSVWMDFDGGTQLEFDQATRSHLLAVGAFGHPDWTNSKLTNAVERMGYSGFNNAIEWQGWYAPRQIRLGASKMVWRELSVGMQIGPGWSPAYVNCTRSDGQMVVASWTQVRFADFIDQYLYYDDLYDGNTWQYGNNGSFESRLQGWRMELVAHQELAYGLGWMASIGTTAGLSRQIQNRAAATFGGQGLVPSDELGPTLTPISIAAAPKVVSVGCSYRIGAFQTGLSWSSMFVSGQKKNDWIAQGAYSIDPIRQARLRIGMNF